MKYDVIIVFATAKIFVRLRLQNHYDLLFYYLDFLPDCTGNINDAERIVHVN